MTIRSRNWMPAAVLGGLAVLAGAPSAEGAATPAYLNTSLSPRARAADLVHRMTLREKASQLVNAARAIPRLGVPAYNWWSEALHGVKVDGTTEFPEPVGLAATFDVLAIHAMAHDIGIEGRVVHENALRAGGSTIFRGLDFWAPNVNIFRDPRWGRGQETYGEDPFLTSRMAVAYVTGMQGSDPHYYLAISTPKHFDVHSGPEPTRHFADVDVSKHDMEDTYLPAFRAAVVDGHAGSVMCAYNAINGQPACANGFLLQHTLRGAWQFQGYVVSDCDAVRDIFNGHHFRPTQAQSSAISLERGMDNECADFPNFSRADSAGDGDYAPFVEAVQQGYLSESAIDTALVRLFTARIRLGMFDPPAKVPYGNVPQKELDSPAHRKLALHLAEESMVLLKNDGVLPLRHVRRIAVVGPLADQTEVLLGNYTGNPTHTVSFLEGLKAEFPEAVISYVPGTPFLTGDPRHPTFPPNDAPDPAAVAAARQADVVIAVVGITSHLEGEEMPVDLPGFLGGDRTSLAMPKPEENLVRAVAATGKPLVVVLMNGSALSVSWEKAHANAILETWYSGEEGGAAIAATLSGRNDPAGRLPVTFYTGVGQLPKFEDYSMAGRTYRYFTGKPLWPFGYGLSYTSFEYADLTLPAAPIDAGDPLTASVRVTNSGKMAGDEVVQLYLKFPDVPGAPIRALRGFQRIHLAAGASQVVRFHLTRRDLSMVTDAGDRIVAQGTYTVSVGGGQPGTGAPSVSGTVRVSGQIQLAE
ncbi:MAG TPA: glycoside hydrolase family 3 C-terminal domain-containing protein [Steroidobacteraceae bacterium]|nr:glycoside hydrolase family 3 C-terminal domain-containing protein [Steroidobacteraceae bacterium]